MSYKEALDRRLKKMIKSVPKEILDTYKKAIEKLIAKHLEEQALKNGDKIPHIVLTNAIGNKTDINEVLKKGPVILTFYRGSWCPYCNLELRLYQELLPQIKKANGTLIAISPDLPDYSLSFSERKKLDFEILSDIDNKIAKQFHLVFKVDKDVVDLYKRNGFELEKQQGNSHYELPIPATYVINQKGIIVLSHVDPIYQHRMEPTLALQKIKEINDKTMNLK